MFKWNLDLPCILDAINDEHHALHEFQCVRMAQGSNKLFPRSKNLYSQVSRGDVERQSIKHNLRRLSLIQSISHTTLTDIVYIHYVPCSVCDFPEIKFI